MFMLKKHGHVLSLFSCIITMLLFVKGNHGQQESGTLVPAIILFGDSTVDVGNNNHLSTAFKANFLPYGRDFVNHLPTGRFCNGKLATDITAETMGFTSYAPPYLSPQATGKSLLIGANFASAASGFDDGTAAHLKALSLTKQLQLFKEYKGKLEKVAGSNKSAAIISDALYILSTGSGDFIHNYYVNPSLNKVYSVDRYSSYLVSSFKTFVKELYGMGARKIGVTSLAPLGCLPAARSLFGDNKKELCISRINMDAHSFNKKLNFTAQILKTQLPGLKIVVFDIFTPLLDLINHPLQNGFVDAREGCCGTGTKETRGALCSPKSVGHACLNATQYVFWDGVHPSEAANQLLADAMITQGAPLFF